MRILVLLTPGFADWEAALLMATARGHLGIEIATATSDGADVVSMGGLRVAPDGALDALLGRGADALVLPGGTAWAGAEAPDIGEAVAAMRASGRPVAAICDAVLALARDGALDAVRHTGNDAASLAATGYGGGARFVASPRAVADGGIVTAPGTAPVSFALAVLELLGRGGADLAGYAEWFAAEHRAG